MKKATNKTDMPRAINQPDFRASEPIRTKHNGIDYWVRTCYELVSGRWEGFVSLSKVKRT